MPSNEPAEHPSSDPSPNAPPSGGAPFGGVLPRGVLAGIVGATAMALWYLVIDGSQGEPFRTPAFIASAVLGMDTVRVAVGPVLMYTVIHYALWIGVGTAVSWLLSRIETGAPVLLGLVLGFALFDVVFYGSVAVTGVDVVAEFGWPSVLVGNLIGGVSLLGTLHLTGAGRTVTAWDAVAANRILREGVVAGLIGAGVVAAWFLIFDLARGAPFFTPAALGSVLLQGVDSLEAVQVNAATVLGYTVLHVGAFVVSGFLAAGVIAAAEETPPLLLGGMLLFVAFEAFLMGMLAILAEFLLGALAWWTIAVGNLLAALAMGAYLWYCHPRLRTALRQDTLDGTT